MMRLSALALCLMLANPTPSMAQQASEPSKPALLVADNVLVESKDRLIATGNVEALYDGSHLTATRIIYDRSTDTIEIEGPIRIVDAQGTVLTADYATLDQEFKNGLLKGARMVLDQQLQLASVEARRAAGRYTQLSRVAVTSCQVCDDQASPLWQIRASRVVHDEVERQLYFDNAQLSVLDVPILYLPYMRLPDPTLKRARGFLVPSVRSSTLLGTGVRIPYFIPIGDHKDLTITPFLTPVTRTLEFRYRQAFANGDLTLTAAASSDSLQPDTFRGYIFANGDFDVPRDFKLRFDINAVLDASYLNDYNISDQDRLRSTITLDRVRPLQYTWAELTHYESLRAQEDNDTQPAIAISFGHEERLFPSLLGGGEFRLSAQGHAHHRYSSIATDSDDADTDVDGRDVARFNGEVSWHDQWGLFAGIRAGASAHLWLDYYLTEQDDTSDSRVSSATPGVAVDLRWPFQRSGTSGSRTLIEPIVQYGWVGGSRQANPNDESTRVEFDEGNLLSLSRFPAADRREHGHQVVAGLRWLHQSNTGWTAAASIGRVWRNTHDDDFTRSSGLEGKTSDWLVSGRYTHPSGLTLSARGLLDDTARPTKAEGSATWSNDRLDLTASYLLLVADSEEYRDTAQSEWTFDTTVRMSTHWNSSYEARYDLADQRLDRLGLGLQYRNECVQVDLKATRKYASATNLEPSTDFDLTVALKGFSTGGSAKEYRRTCAH
ncbi:MAG: LPS-assembly protein LptD [Pelagimonas sp.]|uniref:LPS-assembly protein LptD n=1 Tax=Pelagimonas sp. TaxID=2073170 RepID=UPI003D6C0FB4